MDIISAADAAAKGDKVYFTGKNCRNGHLAPRYVSCGVCKECARLSLSGTRKLRSAAAKARFSCKRIILLEIPEAQFESVTTMLKVCGLTWRDPQAVKSAGSEMLFREWFDNGEGKLTQYDPHTGKLIFTIWPDGHSNFADGSPGPQYQPPPITGSSANSTGGPPADFDPRR